MSAGGGKAGVRLDQSERASLTRIRSRYLFDHLVGDRKHPRRNGKAERLRGVGVNRQFNFLGQFDRQIGRFRTLENPTNICATDAAVQVQDVIAGADQTVQADELPKWINCGQLMVASETIFSRLLRAKLPRISAHEPGRSDQGVFRDRVWRRSVSVFSVPAKIFQHQRQPEDETARFADRLSEHDD
jgi:hypothetical protein